MHRVGTVLQGIALSSVVTLLMAMPACAPPALQTVTLSPETLSVPSGLSHQYTLLGSYSDGTVVDLTARATWVTSDQAIATISGSGLVRMVAPGDATVSASFEHLSAAHPLTVTDATLELVFVTPKSVILPLGAVEQLAALGTFSDGTTQDISNVVSWSSNAQLVAACDSMGRAVATGVGSAQVTAAFRGVSGVTTVDVTAAALLTLHVAPGPSSLALGRSRQVLVTATFTDGTTLDVSAMATWSSSDGAKVGITQQGLATALNQGDASIHASYGTKQVDVPLTVTAAAIDSIQLLPSEVATPKGTVDQLEAKGTYSDGTISDVTDLATWTSSDHSIATVDDASSKGLVTGVNQGASTITATIDGVKADLIMSVGEPEVVQVEVSPSAPNVPIGLLRALTAVATYSDGSSKDMTSNAIWSAVDSTVATVTVDGVVTAVAQGTTGVTAQVDDVVGLATVTATAPVLLTIDVLPQDETLPQGLTDQYFAYGNYSDGRRVDITAQATWGQTLPNATVNPTGLVTGQTPGPTAITAGLGGIVGSADLTVTAAILQSITVTPASPAVAVGLTKAFIATGSYSNATVGNITDSVVWASSNVGSATIANTNGARGVATGKTQGTTTTISATMSGISGSTVLSVTAPVLVSIALTPTDPRISSGNTVQMTATGTMSDSTTIPLTQLATWNFTLPLVATVSNVAGSQGAVSVLKKGGPGTLSATYNGIIGSTQVTGVVGFTRATNAALNIKAESVKLADFNGDGKLDYVASWGWTGLNQLAVGLGNGDGTFAPAVYFWPGGLGAADVVTGDFN